MPEARTDNLDVLVKMLMHQDRITWIAFNVSLTVQAALGTIFLRFADDLVFRGVGVAMIGMFLAFAFGLMIRRSNAYMSFYTKEAVKAGLPDITLGRRFTARGIMASLHITALVGWLAAAVARSLFIF